MKQLSVYDYFFLDKMILIAGFSPSMTVVAGNLTEKGNMIRSKVSCPTEPIDRQTDIFIII